VAVAAPGRVALANVASLAKSAVVAQLAASPADAATSTVVVAAPGRVALANAATSAVVAQPAASPADAATSAVAVAALGRVAPANVAPADAATSAVAGRCCDECGGRLSGAKSLISLDRAPTLPVKDAMATAVAGHKDVFDKLNFPPVNISAGQNRRPFHLTTNSIIDNPKSEIFVGKHY
jgi:hypothetical protein